MTRSLAWIEWHLLLVRYKSAEPAIRVAMAFFMPASPLMKRLQGTDTLKEGPRRHAQGTVCLWTGMHATTGAGSVAHKKGVVAHKKGVAG